MIRGIDVSRWQGAIDWRAVAGDGIAFAWIKATDGARGIDKSFAENWSGALYAGEPSIRRGAYHVMRAGQGREQAEHFLRIYPGGGELPPVLDLERADDTHEVPNILEALAWIEIVAEETGVQPMVYTSPSFAIEQHLGEHPALAKCDLWVAHWGAKTPRVPRPWTTWRAHQTGVGRVAGIRGAVDVNVMA
jgi:lysozyme